MSRKWALAQINAGNVVEKNLQKVIEMVEIASENGATFVAFPEFCLIRGSSETIVENSFEDTSKEIQSLQNKAQDCSIAILVGSIPMQNPEDENKCFNESLLISEHGEITSRYRKMHLFNIDLKENLTVSESRYQTAGENLVNANVNGLNVGMTICYDLRFPELYRKLVFRGAQILLVPSNFTRETGRAHWKPLLRARAIENQAYVVAPNQYGENPETSVFSLGQSVVVDPWGQIITCASDQETVLTAEIDMAYLNQVREKLPSLEHNKIDLE